MVNGILTRKLAMAQDAPRCLAADQADRLLPRSRNVRADSWLSPVAARYQPLATPGLRDRMIEIPTVNQIVKKSKKPLVLTSC